MSILKISDKVRAEINELNNQAIEAERRVHRHVAELVDECCLVKKGDILYDLKTLSPLGEVISICPNNNYDGPGCQQIDYEITLELNGKKQYYTASNADKNLGTKQMYLEILKNKISEIQSDINS